MTLTRKGRFFHYDFRYKGQRHQGSTEQTTRADAELVEAELKRRLRQERWGIAPVDREQTPTFSRWAERVYREQAKRLKRPDFVASCLRVALEFWGQRPTRAPRQAAVPHTPRGTAPYHNLRLLDPIADPSWVLRFEDWMDARGLSGSRKNHLRSAMSVLYKIAMEPAWRAKTRVAVNPFAGLRRDRVRSRSRVMTVDEIRRWMEAAPYHLRVAMALAVLAPKLRVTNILRLRFGHEVDDALTRIVVADHKADRHAPPLVVPIGPSLRAFLEAVRKVNQSRYVVEYQGGPVRSVKTAMRASATAAGLTYGIRGADGVTFHTLRHSVATLLTMIPGVNERLRAEVMGQTIQTAQKYTHLAAEHQIAVHAALEAAAPVLEVVGMVGGKVQGPGEPDSPKLAEIRPPRRRIPRAQNARK
ncbi:MAG: tyrosine-type recombinase/integrase [Vicinamibacterales bacterium]